MREAVRKDGVTGRRKQSVKGRSGFGKWQNPGKKP